MLKNYLLTSFRFLKRYKDYSFINIVGLSIGLASCLLIFHFLIQELSYDKFHADGDNIYRLTTDYSTSSGDVTKMINSPPALAPGIREIFAEVEKSTRLRYATNILFRMDDKVFYENQGFYADSVFLDIFNFKLISGNQHSALDNPNSIVITEEMAQKYFGKSNPVGQTINMNNDLVLIVTGILSPIPTNSHIQFDFLISFPTYEVPSGVLANLSSWGWLGFLTYVKLTDGSNPVDFKHKLDQLYQQKAYEGMIPHQSQVQSLHNIYFGSAGMINDQPSNIRSGNKSTIYALAVIAILILLIATFNFMNLTTAISLNRTKEIGLRKVLGANKSKIIFQLLLESVVIAIISLILGYSISFVVVPFLNQMLGWNIEINWITVFYSLPIAVIVALFVGLLAGIYPSLLLSNFKVVSALKNTLKVGVGTGAKLRNTLVVLQFSISIGLIITTIVIFQQTNFMKEQSPGFNRDNVVVVKLLPEDMTRYYDTFKSTLIQNSNIVSVSRSARLMGEPWPTNSIHVDGRDASQAKQIVGNWVDYDYLKTMGITLKEGRTFSKAYVGDSLRAIVINEKAVAHLGLENPIGQKLWFFSFDGPRTVVGVVKDFNFASLHSEISPVALIISFIEMQHMYIRVVRGDPFGKIAAIESSWKQLPPDIPLDWKFMDEHLNQLYKNEEKLSYLISGFSLLAIMLASIGLYGMVSLMVNNRRKEVGIRKVLGASISSLMLMFSKQYVLMISIAAIIAIPVMQYILNLWLENFAYRIEVAWWVYLISAIILVITTLITISHQTVKITLANPIDSLRNE